MNIKKCTCVHDWQDWKWGKGMRVHNPITNKTNVNKWRCTVCLKEKK